MGNNQSYILTQRINVILLLITLVYVASNKNVRYDNLQTLAVFNLIISLVDYLPMLYISNPNSKTGWAFEGVRYIDWLITTPINTYVIWYFFIVVNNPHLESQFPYWQLILPVILNNFMSLLVWYSKYTHQSQNTIMLFTVLGWIFLAISIYQVIRLTNLVQQNNGPNTLLTGYFLIGTWIGYTIAQSTPDPTLRYTINNIVDLFAKIIFLYYFSFYFTMV